MRIRLAGGMTVLLALLAGCGTDATADPASQPMTEIWYRNRSSEAVDVRAATREHNPDGSLASDGAMTGEVPQCDVGGAAFGVTPGQTQRWSVAVDGTVVLTSDADVPKPQSGEAVRIIIDIPPDGAPTVESVTLGPASPEGQVSAALDELRADLDCR